MAQFLGALPKAELHVHLVGSASPATILRLARRHSSVDVPTEPEMIAAWLDFANFSEFASAYGHISRLVIDGEDVQGLVMGLGEHLASATVRYAEVTVTPLTHLDAGVGDAELAQALEAGAKGVAAEHGIELGWVFDISGDLGVSAGTRTLDWIRRHAPTGTLALGLGGPEVGVPRGAFAAVFAEARALGLRSAPHAGETVGPRSVWEALQQLGAERIGHGIRSVDDPELLAHLARSDVTLEVCPTSNIRTGAVSTIERHPLPELLAAGVRVTLGTDNPGLFATDLVREYLCCHEVLGLGVPELVALVRTGIDGAFCSASTRSRLHREIERQLARYPSVATDPS